MPSKFLFLFIIFSGLIFPYSAAVNAQTKSKSKSAKTKQSPVKESVKEPVKEKAVIAKIKIPPLSKLENEITEEMNFVRSNPSDYIKIMEEMRKYYSGNSLKMPGKKTFQTTEGIKALDEAIEILKSLKPLETLKVSCSAVRAARDHLADLQKSGAFSHFGSDGSSPQERLKKYISGEIYSSENMIGRNGTARDIVIMMLLDDGLPNRQHRKNLLESRFKFTGIASGNNINNLNITVIEFSDSSADIEPCEMN